MKWTNKIYTFICESKKKKNRDDDSSERRVSANIAALRNLGAVGEPAHGPRTPEQEKKIKDLKADTMRLITKARLIKSPPKQR